MPSILAEEAACSQQGAGQKGSNSPLSIMEDESTENASSEANKAPISMARQQEYAGAPEKVDEGRNTESEAQVSGAGRNNDGLIKSTGSLGDLFQPVAKDQSTASDTVGDTCISSNMEGSISSPQTPSNVSKVSAGFTGPTTASTDSVHTVRASALGTPNPIATPSYPFPKMSVETPQQPSTGVHRPFTALSPTVAPTRWSHTAQDDASKAMLSFIPVAPSTTSARDLDGSRSSGEESFLSLSQMILKLNSEPGLDPWWERVVEIFAGHLSAERISLAVPADTNDPENVPWGQRAVYNVSEDDSQSLEYLQQGSLSHGANSDSLSAFGSEPFERAEQSENSPPSQGLRPVRPSLLSRHSLAGHEIKLWRSDNRSSVLKPNSFRAKRSRVSSSTSVNAATSEVSSRDQTGFNGSRQILGLPLGLDLPDREFRGRVHPVLQSLDLEANPLIDSVGVSHIIDQGCMIVATPGRARRDFGEKTVHGEEQVRSLSPGVQEAGIDIESLRRSAISKPSSSLSFIKKGVVESRPYQSGEVPGRLSELKNSSDELTKLDVIESVENNGKEAQSLLEIPDPSTSHLNTGEGFDKSTSSDGSASRSNPRRKGRYTYTENVSNGPKTVIHLPLYHPILSKPRQTSRFKSEHDLGAEEQQRNSRGTFQAPEEAPEHARLTQNKSAVLPIAIISISSSSNPYPSENQTILEHLAPHLATSFSQSQHFSNLQAEAAGLSRNRGGRLHMTNFGRLPFPGVDQSISITAQDPLLSPALEDDSRRSAHGSVTSASDYSAFSKSSTGGSRVVTPNWDHSANAAQADQDHDDYRIPSNTTQMASEAIDSYFAIKKRGKVTSTRSGNLVASANEDFPTQGTTSSILNVMGYQGRTPADDSIAEEDSSPRQVAVDSMDQGERSMASGDAKSKSGEPSLAEKVLLSPRESVTSPQGDIALSRISHESPRRQAIRQDQSQKKSDRSHTMLHSKGADFAATFQSLPSAAGLVNMPEALQVQSRSNSRTRPAPSEMLPPSPRFLKSIVDYIPVQLFVANPLTGSLRWVNSRLLSYRGQLHDDLLSNPFGSLHADQRKEYLKEWKQSLMQGDDFQFQIQIRRFDGQYRWFLARASPLKDSHGVIQHYLGTYVDIHDQRLAEIHAARQEEIAISESRYRALANSVPQINFAGTPSGGITFTNTRWLEYSGQELEESLHGGFLRHVHPDDLAKCNLPAFGKTPELPKEDASLLGPESARTRSSSQSGFISDTNSSNGTLTGLSTTRSKIVRPSAGERTESNAASLQSFLDEGVFNLFEDQSGRTFYSADVRLRDRQGEYKWHQMRCNAVDSDDSIGTWFGSFTDIDEHKALERQLKEAINSKTRFLSNMSHEIRTPLNGVFASLQFLIDTKLDEDQLESVMTIHNSCNTLSNLINLILDGSKIEAGMMTLTYEWFDIRSTIEDAIERCYSLASAKNLELNYVVEEQVPNHVKGDQARVEQILINLIGNAIKFTEKGEVFARCKIGPYATSETDHGINLVFEVTDTGRGFSEEEGRSLFKAFSQIDGSSTRRQAGTGLGLAICKDLVELHGGSISATAIPGKGSVFTFQVKFIIASAIDHPKSASAHSPHMNKMSVASPTSDVGSQTRWKPDTPSSVEEYYGSPSEFMPISEGSHLPHRDKDSPAVASSASSDPSIRSLHTAHSYTSQRSSVSSIVPHLAAHETRERRKASQMNLVLPSEDTSQKAQEDTPAIGSSKALEDVNLRPNITDHPPMYLILVVCPQKHSREATISNIEGTLPSGIPKQIVSCETEQAAKEIIQGEHSVLFTHVVTNLGSAKGNFEVIDLVMHSIAHESTSIVILASPQEAKEIKSLESAFDLAQLNIDGRVSFVSKPVKRSRLAAIFNPKLQRTISTDPARPTIQQMAKSQKQVFAVTKAAMAGKGFRILCAEDDPVNQRILIRYFARIGVMVDVVDDGVACTERLFALSHDHYSLILCDISMPRKDGYDTCRDVRSWETKYEYQSLPIIALSANVMEHVHDECCEAGFSDYITKPIDTKELSSKLIGFLIPTDPTKRHDLMMRRN